MRKLFLFWPFLCWLYSFAQENTQEIRIEGRYNGKNLFLQNPIHKSYDSFCIEEIQLNSEVLLRSPRSSAVEIRLDHLPFRAAVHIRILHKKSCRPKVINPEVLLRVGYTTFSYFYSKENKLYWRTEGEEPDASYTVEFLNGDAWEKEATILRSDLSAYMYSPKQLVEGVNKFRVKYSSSTFSLYSTDVEILLRETIITFSPQVVRDRMTLSERTYFEILDAKQNIILKGTATRIPLRKLKPGDYFIVLDGKTYPFVKR